MGLTWFANESTRLQIKVLAPRREGERAGRTRKHLGMQWSAPRSIRGGWGVKLEAPSSIAFTNRSRGGLR